MTNSAVHEAVEKARAVLSGVWRMRWIGVTAAWVVGGIAAALLALVSDRYEASAKVYVDTQTVLKPLMAGLAVQPDTDQQVKMLARTLVSRPNIERLMDNPSLGLAPARPSDREGVLTLLMSKIKVDPAGTGNLYAISYRDPDPHRARGVVENLVALFMNSTAGDKKRDAEEAQRFIDSEIRSYEAKLAAAEGRLKDFKLKNFGVSGVSNQDYFARISALADSVAKLQTELHAGEQSREALRRELSAEPPQLPTEPSSTGSPAQRTDAEVRLDQQKAQLDELLRRYTDQHPDVVSLRRMIASLEQQVRSEALARARIDAERGRSGAAATSPVYQRIRISLAQTEADVASLRSRLSAEQARLAEVRATANRVPQVEAELAQLNRDYEVIRRNYEQLVSRRESASIGVRLDESSQMAEFRLVEPPRVAPGPVKPSRFMLALGALAFSIVAGFAAAYAANALRPTFMSAKALGEAFGHPVLGTVSLFDSGGSAPRRNAERLRFGAATALLMFAQLVWLAWILTQSQR